MYNSICITVASQKDFSPAPPPPIVFKICKKKHVAKERVRVESRVHV